MNRDERLTEHRITLPIVPADPAVPSSVPMVKAHLALLAAGKLDAVYAAINALPSPSKEAATIWFDKAATLERAHPLVAQLAPAIGLTDAGVDSLMVAADAITE